LEISTISSLHDGLIQWLAHGYLDWAWWQIVIFTLVMTHITIASVTIFLHRCQAHRALDLHAIPSHFFRFWLWLTTGMVTKEWASVHRKHHAKCESVEDPHSPQVLGIDTVLLRGAELYKVEAAKKETLEKFGHGTPDDWIEHKLYSRFTWQGVGLMLIIDLFLFGAIGATVWAVQMLWIPITAAGVINGIGHYWGYRNYDCEDASTNIVPWGILIGGEELHNNHHTYATSAKLSNKWYEFDIGWLYISILAALGLAKVKKVAPEPKFDRSKLVADLDTLHAVVANRYDVMAKYARSLRSAWREEVDQIRASSALGSGFLKSSKKLLQREPASLETSQRQQLSELFEHSSALKTMHEMRVELGAIWERSHFTSEQLLQQLRDWCARAEASGIRSLREFSLRLRTYA